MDTVDFILNLAGVLLWVNWRMAASSPGLGTPTTLLGTLRRAEPTAARKWYFLAALPVLLTFRAWIYWEIGSTTPWVPILTLGPVAVAFRCDLFQRAFAYSALSFGAALAVFYLCLLLLSVLNRRPPNPDPFGRFVGAMLGPVRRWNSSLQLMLPTLAGIPLWFALSFLFARMQLLPPPGSSVHRLTEGVLVGLSAYLSWSHLLGGILLLHLLNTYIHFGDHALWGYVSSLARTFLAPFRRLPLRVGKVDLSPVVALALVYLLARGGARLLLEAERRLPL